MLSSNVTVCLDRIAFMSNLLGLPVISNTNSSWCTVDFPGNIGLPPSISPRIAPIDHTEQKRKKKSSHRHRQDTCEQLMHISTRALRQLQCDEDSLSTALL